MAFLSCCRTVCGIGLSVGLLLTHATASQPTPGGSNVRPIVRLELRIDSWLGETPFQLEQELTSALQDADVTVTRDPMSPIDAIVEVAYHEERDLRYAAGVYGTRIAIKTRVVTPDGTAVTTMGPFGVVSPRPDPFALPSRSTEALRDDAIAIVKTREPFVFFGDSVGVALGQESSFRYLLFGPLAAIEALGSIGDAGAAEQLEELASREPTTGDPRIVRAARIEAANIQSRLARD